MLRWFHRAIGNEKLYGAFGGKDLGIFRLWLATAVVLQHTGPSFLGQPLNGNVAVSAFYVISGFYIQLLISEKYSGQPHWIRNFYQSRALRIFPLYYFFLVLSLPDALKSNETITRTFATENFATAMFVVAENLLIFGQDIGRFLKVELPSGSLLPIYGPLLDRASLSATSLPVLGQAWSLAVEFGFYLLAPAILTRRTWTVIAVALCSLGARFIASYHLGNGHYWYLWNAFLPSEIAVFLVGALGCRFYRKYLTESTPNRAALCFLVIIAVYSVVYRDVETYSEGGVYAGFVILAALAVPVIFAATRRNDLDRFIGELSYPVYLGHLYVIHFVGRHALASPDWAPAVSLIGIILLSIPLVLLIEEPIAAFRHRRFAKRASSR